MDLNQFTNYLKELLDAQPANEVRGEIEIDGKLVRVTLSYNTVLSREVPGGNPRRITELAESAKGELEEVNQTLIER